MLRRLFVFLRHIIFITSPLSPPSLFFTSSLSPLLFSLSSSLRGLLLSLLWSFVFSLFCVVVVCFSLLCAVTASAAAALLLLLLRSLLVTSSFDISRVCNFCTLGGGVNWGAVQDVAQLRQWLVDGRKPREMRASRPDWSLESIEKAANE